MTQRMISRDRQRHRLSSRCDARNEITDLGQTPAQACSRVDRRRLRHTEALQGQLALQTLNVFTEEDNGKLVVSRGEVDLAKPCTRHDLQGGVSARRGTGARALTPVDGSISITGQAEVVGQIRGRSSEPSLIAQSHRERLGFSEVFEYLLEPTTWLERVAEIETNIDRLLAKGRAIR